MQLLAIQEYGLRCLVQVAFHPGPSPITGPEIARREGLGREYVARIMAVLRTGGLVVSTRGAAGGYHLARPASQINVWEALCALGGQFFAEGTCGCRPGRERECVHVVDCAMRALWQKVESTLRLTLQAVSLEDLRRDESSMVTWLESVNSPEAGPYQ